MSDGTVADVSSEDQTSVAVQPVADGFRALVTIPSADQPERYEFPIGGDVDGVVADPWVAAAALAAAAWCAKGALASVPTTALSDIVAGKSPSKKSYVVNAVAGCIGGEIGAVVWKFLPGAAKTWAINQVIMIALKWRS